MPIDAGGYLASRGWKGKGKPLRANSIAKPVILSQKKSLSGVGRDRDDQFAFWDHIYSVSAQTISIKLHSDEEDDTGASPSPDPGIIQRTHTGIISHRRPHINSSGSCTPIMVNGPESGSVTPKLSVMALARREAAKRGLYSRFYRGPIITSEWESVTSSSNKIVEVTEEEVNNSSSETPVSSSETADGPPEETEVETQPKIAPGEQGLKKKKKKRSKDREEDDTRKRKSKKGKERELDEEEQPKKKSKKRKHDEMSDDKDDQLAEAADHPKTRRSKQKDANSSKSSKEEKKKRKKSKRRKEECSS
ncbi:hypothetical protein FRC02_007686 [Tulasnella sp. 418]|nr:hypothetical protein FRC02_007686 [Tulasnella sp. 418]